MPNPYLLDLPAVVSFSGGRTSGFMLRHILDAHGGQPDNLKVCFQNTGLEHPATYDFVQECGDRWGVDVVWLEYCIGDDGKPTYRRVDHATASRNGEPFTALNKRKQYLPNPIARLCTVNLKIWVLAQYLGSLEAFGDGYTNAIGLRFDEPRRVLRTQGDKDAVTTECPLYRAQHTEADVLGWWGASDFDLRLPLKNNRASNCIGCFLKGRQTLETLMLEYPEAFDWWIEAESTPLSSAPMGGRFRNDRPSYADMREILNAQGWLFDPNATDEDTIPCMCTD